MFNFEGKSKWDAWNSVKGMAKDDAMKNYVEEIDRQHAKYGD